MLKVYNNMSGTCLTCLSPKNLIIMGELEWRIFDILLYPMNRKYPNVRNNNSVRLCIDCQNSMKIVDEFRKCALFNFQQLMSIGNMSPTAQSHDLKIPKEELQSDDEKEVENFSGTVLTHELKKPKEEIESDNEDEVETFSEIPDKKVTVEATDYDTDETMSDQEFKFKLENEESGDPLCIREPLTHMKPPPPTLKMPPPTLKTPQPTLKTPPPTLKQQAPTLKQQAPTLKPPPHTLKPPLPTLKPPPPTLKQQAPTLKQQAPTLKQQAPTLKQQAPTLKQQAPTLKTPPPTLKLQPPTLKPPPPTLPSKSLLAKDNFYCQYCNKPFAVVGKVLEHEERVHGNLPKETCPICNTTLKDKYRLRKHLNWHKNKNIHCEVCDKWYTKPAYKVHLKLSLKHRKVEDFGSAERMHCTKCNKWYRSKSFLNSHIKNVHVSREKKYCTDCKKWFNPVSYKTHFRISSKHVSEDDKRFTCDHCSKKFVVKGWLEQHMKIVHLKLKPFKCPHCPRAFSLKTPLRNHLRYVHENIPEPKNYVCETCGKAFKTSSLLRKHMPVHTGERPYKCGKCDATFGHKAALFLHNRYKHEKKKCPPKKKKETKEDARNVES